jgi:hypothetical protein
MSDVAVMFYSMELARHKRFAFGSNWLRFLSMVDEDRVRRAQKTR